MQDSSRRIVIKGDLNSDHLEMNLVKWDLLHENINMIQSVLHWILRIKVVHFKNADQPRILLTTGSSRLTNRRLGNANAR